MKKLLVLLILAFNAWSQTPPPFNIQISQQPLPPVNNLFANYTGTQGQLTYYYWIVAIYGVGNSALSPTPAMVTKIDSSGSVSIGWSNPANPSSYTLTYDVLRTTSNVQFQSCSNCLVASGTSLLSTTDTLGALGGYSVSTYSPQPNPLVITLNNIDARQVLLKGFINGSNIIPIGPGPTAANQVWYNDANGNPTGSEAVKVINGAIQVSSATTNSNGVFQGIPNGTATSFQFRIFNGSDTTNAGSLLINLSGTTLSYLTRNNGTGTAVTNMDFGENASVAALTNIRFRFANTIRASIDSTGVYSGTSVILTGATFQLNGKTCAIVSTVLTCT